jgi:hypothetical protein
MREDTKANKITSQIWAMIIIKIRKPRTYKQDGS